MANTFTDSVVTLSALCLLLGLTGAGSLQAGTVETTTPSDASVATVTPKDESIYDKIWSIPKLYRNDSNPVIEEFDAIGRFQEDYFNVDSNKGSTSFFEIRRLRIGADAFLAERHLQLEAEVDTSLRAYNSPSIFYYRFTNLWAKFSICNAFNIRFGKFQPHFGADREFSNNLLKVFERGFFDDQLLGTHDYITGGEASGKFGHFGYLAAMYSTNDNKEYGKFDGGQAYQAEINYDFAPALKAEKALWVLDYLHADGKNAYTNVFTTYRTAVATYFDFTRSRFSLVTQLAYGNQVDHLGDVYSFQFMPSYMITDKLEFLFRYQLGLATESNGISTLNRQQKTVGTFTGDNYNACYLGLDYYLYGQKLKLMFGEEYAALRGGSGPAANDSGWTTLVGLRLFF